MRSDPFVCVLRPAASRLRTIGQYWVVYRAGGSKRIKDDLMRVLYIGSLDDLMQHGRVGLGTKEFVNSGVLAVRERRGFLVYVGRCCQVGGRVK
jgi:hypothetical protein